MENRGRCNVALSGLDAFCTRFYFGFSNGVAGTMLYLNGQDLNTQPIKSKETHQML